MPVVAAALGPCAGLGAARVVLSHFSVIVRGTAQLFVAGPPVVAWAMGETPDKEQLGGARAQTRAGAVDNEAADEEDALAQLRRFLSYLPASVWEAPPVTATTDPAGRREEELLAIVPRDDRKTYKMRRIVELVFDRGSVFELGRRFGRPLITALARLDGRPVGVLASDPEHYGGGLTADAAEKLARFIDLCDQFRLPVVNFVDQPGFVVGTASERAGTIRRGARALAAVHQASTPWCSILVRKCYGIAGAGHGDGARLNLRYAWPSGRLGLAADRRRARGRLPARARGRRGLRRPRGAARRDRGAAARRALPVPHGRALLDRGHHRPARHPPAAVRVGRAGPRLAAQDVAAGDRSGAAGCARRRRGPFARMSGMPPRSPPTRSSRSRRPRPRRRSSDGERAGRRRPRAATSGRPGRIAGTRHIELERLASQAATIDRDRPVVFQCRSGVRSAMAAQAFRAAGFDAWSMAGGLTPGTTPACRSSPDGGRSPTTEPEPAHLRRRAVARGPARLRPS